MPFICMPAVTNSTDEVLVQITDLFPHKTQSNATLTPRFQGPRYFRAPFKGDLIKTVSLDASFVVQEEVAGLSAYLVATIENTNAGNVALVPHAADTIAQNILNRVAGALALDADGINAAIQAETGGGVGINNGNSSATVEQVLQIVSGTRIFTLPANKDVGDENNGGAFIANDVRTFFTTPTGVKDISSNDGSFFTSARLGQISIAQSKTDSAGNSTPVLVAYNNDGTLILQ
tara:strand:- start:411 stop:1109 length:699 start_codon:yes stop_codon:yes gene_type:complete